MLTLSFLGFKKRLVDNWLSLSLSLFYKGILVQMVLRQVILRKKLCQRHPDIQRRLPLVRQTRTDIWSTRIPASVGEALGWATRLLTSGPCVSWLSAPTESLSTTPLHSPANTQKVRWLVPQLD